MSLNLVISGLLALVGALIAFALYDCLFAWPEYRDSHHCQTTGETKTEYVTVCHHYGKTMMCLPQPQTRDEYLCDQEERIWR